MAMGGKSRKGGQISRKLIEQLKRGEPSKCGKKPVSNAPKLFPEKKEK